MNKTAQITSVLAIIIALIALVLAWTTFNRTGADFDAVVQREVDEAMIEINANFEEFERSLRESLAEDMEEGAEQVDVEAEADTAGGSE